MQLGIGLGIWFGVFLALGAGRAAAEPPPPPPTDAPPPQPSPESRKTREFNIAPLVGGNSDIGAGIGQISNVSGLGPGIEPYRWQLESSGFISFLPHDGGVVVPLQDYFVAFHLPDLGAHHVRFDVRASYTLEKTLLFYGIGNASKVPAGGPSDDTEFGRLHPALSIQGRVPVYRDVYVNAGSVTSYNRLDVPATSILASYATQGPADARPFIGPFTAHTTEVLALGVQYDTRDHEIDTRNGQFHAAQVRYSPKIGSALPYGYERVTLIARVYRGVTDRVTLSARLVGDVVLGDAPFYELARYEETPAIGGINAVRGVPAYRYYGKVKAFGNLEARSDLFGFHLFGKKLKLGAAAFFDAGRTWTELLHAHPDLDGTGVGLKYGIGGGLRLQQGATFVLRADLAYSPDARPVGAYFTANQIF
ncbi:MAG TPA: BamA/TamA family outer membrane protein [Kofleriaceae bacterium]|nr:BamA/TamA family outer membrane protein [Kofleriaceae bacterium]